MENITNGLLTSRTFRDMVYLDGAAWQGMMNPDDQLFSLAHEITHSAQWSEAGYTTFAARYVDEQYMFHGVRGVQYDLPQSLLNMSLGSFDLRNPNYTYDEIADRVAYAASPNSTIPQKKGLSAYGF